MKIVHCKKSKEPFILIDRTTRYGNPFKIGQDGTREQVLEKYEAWMRQNPDLIEFLEDLMNASALGCWCAPAPCHGNVIIKLIEEFKAKGVLPILILK